jgi:hypothetical protein
MVAWFNERIDLWASSAAEIGLDPLAVTAFKAQLESVNGQISQMAIKRNAARAATINTNASAAVLRAAGSGLIATIKAFAETSGNEDVYEKSNVPPPAPPSPAPPPVAPELVTADPNAVGTITLKIRGSVAQNGSFHIERSIDGGAWVLVNPTREKTWTDMAVPMNTNTIAYRVFGVRDSKRSDTATGATVNFGNLPPELQAAFRTGAGPVAKAA